jgi:hypothetical protein
LGNLMIALATNRHYAYQSIGALGVIELTAPGRAAKVNAGMKRHGIGGGVRRYFALHATLDIRHSQAWNREVLRPLVDENRAARCDERRETESGVTRAARQIWRVRVSHIRCPGNAASRRSIVLSREMGCCSVDGRLISRRAT